MITLLPSLYYLKIPVISTDLTMITHKALRKESQYDPTAIPYSAARVLARRLYDTTDTTYSKYSFIPGSDGGELDLNFVYLL